MTASTSLPQSCSRRGTALLLRFQDGSAASVWARRLSPRNGRGFVLREPAPDLTLLPGDIVSADTDAQGELQVTGVLALNGHFHLVFRPLPEIDTEYLEELLDLWDDEVIHELPDGRFLVIWEELLPCSLEETHLRLALIAQSPVDGNLRMTSQYQRSRSIGRRLDLRLAPAPLHRRVLAETLADLHRRMYPVSVAA